VRLVLPALLILLVALAAPTTAGPRAGKSGKIVRVERPRTGARGTPRICQMIDVKAGRCYGKAPVAGEIGWVVGSQKNHGTVRIGKVEPSDTNCPTPQFWSFEIEEVDASLAGLEPYGSYILIDVDVTASARVVEPSRVKGPDNGESPWIAIDRSGSTSSDNPADMIVTAFACDEQGQRYPNGGYSNGGYCMDYYTHGGGSRWDLIRRDVVIACRY
jgi:hypothetical protein